MQAQTDIEIEAKFVVKKPDAVAMLGAADRLSDTYLLGQPVSGEYLDRYVDSADYGLLRRGYSLRLRTVGDRRLATLKSLKVRDQLAADTRLEIEEPINADAAPTSLEGWPESIRPVLHRVLGEVPTWHTLCTIEQTRLKRPIVNVAADSQPVAELSLDHVSVYEGDRTGTSSADGASQVIDQFDEVEAELLSGLDAAELDPISRELSGISGLRAGSTSKLESALAAISRHSSALPAGTSGITPEMHVGEACRLIWRTQMMQALLNEHGVRVSADIEYVHAMRVAARRARAAGVLFGGFLRRKAIKRHLAMLRQMTRRLGAVRDMDVALDNLARFQRKHEDSGRTVTLAEQWQFRRDKQHAKLLVWLDGEKYGRFVQEFSVFCATPGEGVKRDKRENLTTPTLAQVRHVVPSMILSRFERMRSYEIYFDSRGDVSIEALHELRIEGKYLRYLLEFVRHLLGEEGESLIKQLKRVQDHLGDLNDAAVMRDRLADDLGDSASEHDYHAAQEEILRSLRGGFAEQFADFVDAENRRTVALAIARL